MNKKSIILKALLFTFFFMLSSVSVLADWIVDSVDFEIDGRTREDALDRFVEMEEGDTFYSESSFLSEFALLKESFENLRILEEFTVDYTMEESGEDTLIHVSIYIKDSWNLIALPYPSFDTNEGTKIVLKVRDYNFMGKMETLSFNLNYIYDTISSDTPTHTLSSSLTYPYNFEIGNYTYTLTASQGYDFLPGDEDDSYFYSTEISLGSSLHIPYSVINGRKPDYHYSLGSEIMYRLNRVHPISEERDGIDFYFDHGVSLGWISWGSNNYREGMAFSVENRNVYTLDVGPSDFPWSGNFVLSGQIHKDLYPWGYTSRIVVDYSPYQKQELGGYLRGVVDDELEADAGVFLNNAVYLTVWNWNPIWEWYGGFVLDMGYLYGLSEDTAADRDPFVYSLGVEGMAFPYKFRNFFARITLGLDAKRIMDSPDGELTERLSGNWEFFFGMGAFY